jgi:hypothetical protein
MSTNATWLKVFHHAQYEDPCDEARELLDRNPDIGLPSCDAWMARYSRSSASPFEMVMQVDEIVSSHGFEDGLEWAGRDEPAAAIWIPRDEIDVKAIVRDLQLPADDLAHLESALMSSIGDQGVAVYAARNLSSRKTEGIIVYDRALTFFSDCVMLEYDVSAMHCTDNPVLEAALLAAFHEQTSTDLQGALDSMTRAGITPRLGFHVGAPTSHLEERLIDLVDVAKSELFDLDPMPDVDIEAFGAWLSGRKKDDEHHILIREPKPSPHPA